MYLKEGSEFNVQWYQNFDPMTLSNITQRKIANKNTYEELDMHIYLGTLQSMNS